MRGWFESTFGAGALAAQFVVALIVVIVLFGIIAAFARRRNKTAGRAQARGRQPRLAVMDMADVDERRKLILIRRDNVEHLVMIGGPSDLVVESTIMRNRPVPHAAPHAAERAPDRAVAGLAVQAQSRASMRASSLAAAGNDMASAEGLDKGSGNASAEAPTAPAVRTAQFVNPYKAPEKEVIPGPASGQEKSPAPAPSVQAASPASSAAAVAGLTAGAAALTAAAASVKRRDPSPDQNTAPQKPSESAPVLPAGFNGGGDSAPAVRETVTPELAAKEPTAVADAGNDEDKPDIGLAVATAAKPDIEPVATDDLSNGATSPAGTQSETDDEAKTDAAMQATEQAAEPDLEPVKTAEKTDDGADEEPRVIPPEEAAPADLADDSDIGNDIEMALAEALAPEPDPAKDIDDTSADAAADLTSAEDDEQADTESVVEATTGVSSTTAAPEETLAKSFDEIMTESTASGDSDNSGKADDSDVAAPPQKVEATTAEAEVSEPEATSGDGDAEIAAKTVEPPAEGSSTISPFPTIPEDVRRSVLEAARRAEGSLDTDPAMADGATKTTLGDLAERLEQALAEQASTLSGQLQPTDGGKPPTGSAPPGADQGPSASIEAWESGTLAVAGQPESGGDRNAGQSQPVQPDTGPDAEPRQSQAMLDDETDAGVIDFTDRKKVSPDNKRSDSLEDEMARLLGELTGGTSSR